MGKRVLIVDDSKDQVDTLRMLLGMRGYVTEGHYSAQTIVACVREFDPDVVVLDLSMPIKDGLAAAREIRAAFHGTRPKLIALSAEHRKPPGKDFDDYLTKPCDPDVLVDLIESDH